MLDRELSTLLANLNRAETFRYLDGDETIATTINPEDVMSIRLDVSLLLTRYKGEQQFQQMLQASNVIKDFYGLPPEVQAYTAPFYQGMVKALDSKLPAEQIIQPVPMQLQPTGQIDPQAGPAAAGQSPNNL